MKTHFHIDSSGSRRAVTEAPFEILGWYLEDDIQSSTRTCDEILAQLEVASASGDEIYSGTGNAHSLYFSSSSVRIENEFVPGISRKVPSEDFRQAVVGWRDFCRRCRAT